MADVGGIAADQLKTIVERIENLMDEKKGIGDDIRDVYAEAKGNGFDPKIIRQVIKLKQMERGDRQELDALVDLYLSALGIN